ncbi:MAG: spermidine/putrescine ABC transporter substrate-binding protein [Oscillospiraceae bacterium]|jgi:spermidine/putrescine transport system substrate-binding protein|nr:spermidine/putrescine ABC transporter substrate-binding protein [Oscillospiraceae bacterium]
MKKTLVILLALSLLLALAACGEKAPTSAAPPSEGRAVGGTLNIYTWEGMFPEDILSNFEAETGVTINYVNFDTDETMLSKLQDAKGGDYDLIIADDYIIELAIQEGLVQKLDAAKLSNYGNINPFYQGQFYDPADEYTIPYGAGVQTIVYDPSLTSIDIKGYADLLDPSLKNNVGVIANYRVIDGLALKINGYSYNTNNIDEINAAGATLLELAPNIRLIKDDNIEDDLIIREVAATVMYTSQVTMAKLAKPDLEVVYPSEGIGFGIMAGFIPSNAPNADAAYAFLNYILDAQRGAECFEWLGYYSTFSASDPLISEEFQSFLTLPEDFKTTDSEMIENISAEADAAHELIWTAFREATGQTD